MVNNLISIIGLGEPEHIILILLVVVLLFGGKKIPEMMRGLGSGVREFNNAKSGIKNDINNAPAQKQNQPESSSITDLDHEAIETKS
jgi:sec-independent protein translocase protein TatA